MSHEQAEDHARTQYQFYEQERRQSAEVDTSDFDETVRRLTEQAPAPKPRRRKKKAGEQNEGDA